MTSVKIASCWRCMQQVTDQFGQVIKELIPPRNGLTVAHRSFQYDIGAIVMRIMPIEVVTDLVLVHLAVLEELHPIAWRCPNRYDNSRFTCDHSRLETWPRPVRWLKRHNSPQPTP